MLYYNRVFIFERNGYPVFLKEIGWCTMQAAQCSQIAINHYNMKIIIVTKSIRERLTIVCEEEPRKRIRVRGHFRVANGRKVYVKTHYRKR